MFRVFFSFFLCEIDNKWKMCDLQLFLLLYTNTTCDYFKQILIIFVDLNFFILHYCAFYILFLLFCLFFFHRKVVRNRRHLSLSTLFFLLCVLTHITKIWRRVFHFLVIMRCSILSRVIEFRRCPYSPVL